MLTSNHILHCARPMTPPNGSRTAITNPSLCKNFSNRTVQNTGVQIAICLDIMLWLTNFWLYTKADHKSKDLHNHQSSLTYTSQLIIIMSNEKQPSKQPSKNKSKSKGKSKQDGDEYESFAADIGAVFHGLSTGVVQDADCFRAGQHSNSLINLIHTHIINKEMDVFLETFTRQMNKEIREYKRNVEELKRIGQEEVDMWESRNDVPLTKKERRKYVKMAKDSYQSKCKQVELNISLCKAGIAQVEEHDRTGQKEVPDYVGVISDTLQQGMEEPYNIYEIFIADTKAAAKYDAAYKAVMLHAKENFMFENIEFVELKRARLISSSRAAKPNSAARCLSSLRPRSSSKPSTVEKGRLWTSSERMPWPAAATCFLH